MKTTFLVGVIAVGAVFGAGCARPAQPPEEQVACTMDAMQCPDGSFVGRVGPSCAFAPCPAPVETPSTTSTSQLPATKDDLIRVDAPLPTTVIQSPTVITGEARGPWYFEASFPIEIRDANNVLLGQTIGQAQADWMTVDYVPFSATLTFTTPTTATGTLVLKKDNPSGEPQNDNALIIPISF
ncbi:hypothetical protein KBD13_00420 [Patescibacteria group bacterium]|jgi:hypothetical protein|nr:hypothetical protein [Patescibacteria group bacterium]MDQ5919786.1 hypothetical protein [Patescibacteria group bacterium]